MADLPRHPHCDLPREGGVQTGLTCGRGPTAPCPEGTGLRDSGRPVGQLSGSRVKRSPGWERWREANPLPPNQDRKGGSEQVHRQSAVHTGSHGALSPSGWPWAPAWQMKSLRHSGAPHSASSAGCTFLNPHLQEMVSEAGPHWGELLGVVVVHGALPRGAENWVSKGSQGSDR